MLLPRRVPAVLLLSLGLLPLAAHAQSISSSGALGPGFFIIVPLVLGAFIGLPSLLVYGIWARLRLGRWPRWWTWPLPLLLAIPLGLSTILHMLDDEGATGIAIAVLGELALIALLVEVPYRLQRKAAD